MVHYRCPVCDEAQGAERKAFRPGRHWERIPDDWCCPDCGVREKIDFEQTSGDDACRASG